MSAQQRGVNRAWMLLILACLLTSPSLALLLLRNSSTVAGVYGSAGSLDGPVTTARLSGPRSVISDGTGGLYVADNDLIRFVKNGTLTTLFGTPGVFGSSNGNRTTALLNDPTSVVFVGDVVYMADPRNHAIRQFNQSTMSLYAGNPANGPGLSDGAGTAALFQTSSSITYVAFDDAFYVADRGNSALRRIARGSATVTTVATSIRSPFYCTSSANGAVYVLNQPTSSTVGIYRYLSPTNTGSQWLATSPLAFVAIGYDTVNDRLFAATNNRIFEIFLGNQSTVLVAGVGTAYLDGPNPRFNFINGMFVESFRRIYVTCGPLAYVVRLLSFDPPAPIPIVITLPAPLILPIDNATALNATLVAMEKAIIELLGTEHIDPEIQTRILASSATFDFEMRRTNITILVANETFNASTSVLLNSFDYPLVHSTAEMYYSQTNFSVVFDAVMWPFLSTNASAQAEVRDIIEHAVRQALGYSYLFAAATSQTSNASDTGALASWKLLLPASFANETTSVILRQLTYAPVAALASALYAHDMFYHVTMGGSGLLEFPATNATEMQRLREAIRDAAEEIFQYSPIGTSRWTINSTAGTAHIQLYVPASFSPSVNATSAALLPLNFTAVLDGALRQYYSTAHSITFDATRFPWSDPVAVGHIRQLLTAAANLALTGSSTTTEVQIQRIPTVSETQRTVTFDVLVPRAVAAAYASDAAIDTVLLSDLVTSSTIHYVSAYYAPSWQVYRASFAALELPVFNRTAMEQLRLAVGYDLAAAVGFANVGANISVPEYSGLSMNLADTDSVFFPLLLPPWLVNNATAAILQTLAYPETMALLAALSTPGLVFDVNSRMLPTTNSTAMEQIRRLLTDAVRQLLSTNSSAVNVLPANLTTIHGSDSQVARYTIFLPVGVDVSLNATQLLADILALLASEGNDNPLGAFLADYYTRGVAVELPFDITPWSNATTMDIVRNLLLTDVRNALRSVSVTSAGFFIDNTTVERGGNRTVRFALVLSPEFGGGNYSATVAALEAAPLTQTRNFLLDYFPKRINISMKASLLPWSDATAMSFISRALADYLASDVFLFDNVGVNGTALDTQTSPTTVTFKIIIPPEFDNATTSDMLLNSTRFDPARILSIASYLQSYYPSDYFATFAEGSMPTSNATAMAELHALLRLDLQTLFGFEDIGVGDFALVEDDLTAARFIQWPMRIPPSFANSTTATLLVLATYPRVNSYLVAYYATPAPPTPSPMFRYSSLWPADSLPTFNETQMEELRAALQLDVVNMLGISDVTVDTWVAAGDGVHVEFAVNLPPAVDNATTGVLLQDVNNYPIFQALLASITQGNLNIVRFTAGAVDEGCSRGCVIGVAAVGAIVVTAGVIGAVVMTSKRRKTATLIAPKFSPVFDDAADADRGAPVKNPLELEA